MDDTGRAARMSLVSGVGCRRLVIKAQQCKGILLVCSWEWVPSLTIRMIYGCCGLLSQHTMASKQSFRSDNQGPKCLAHQCTLTEIQ